MPLTEKVSQNRNMEASEGKTVFSRRSFLKGLVAGVASASVIAANKKFKIISDSKTKEIIANDSEWIVNATKEAFEYELRNYRNIKKLRVYSDWIPDKAQDLLSVTVKIIKKDKRYGYLSYTEDWVNYLYIEKECITKKDIKKFAKVSVNSLKERRLLKRYV